MPGLHVVFGGEGSAKSTMEMKIMGASLAHDIPVRGYYDAEGALDRRYTSQVIRTDDFESIFGDRDASGRWVRPALVRYYDSNIMEEVFGSMHQILRQMPDKGYSERLGCWMLRFDKTRPQQILMNELYKARVISEPHKRLLSATGMYWCETDNASPQAVFFLDSLPQLIPERIESGQNSDKASGWQSAGLGQGLRYVRGLCRPKAAIIQSVNQLRKNVRPDPGQPDWVEPAGEQVKFNSDSRWMFSTVTPKGAWSEVRTKDADGGKRVCTEKSVDVEGGFDTYAFKNITCIKNKYGSQNSKTSIRIWTRDARGVARGIDPVYDTLYFLGELDLLVGFQPAIITDWRRRFRIHLPRINEYEWTYGIFKAFILGQDYGDTVLTRRAAQAGAPVRFKMRDYCFRMIQNGMAGELRLKAARSATERKLASVGDLEADSEE